MRATRTERVLNAFENLWTGSKLDRDTIEARLIGAQIVGIYPICSKTASGRTYATGVSIAYRRLSGKNVETVDIEAGNGEIEDELSVIFTDDYIEPEETAFIGG